MPDGYDVDIARRLAKDRGVKLEIVSVANENRTPTLLTGEADVIAATLQITPERAESVLFTLPYSMHQSRLWLPACSSKVIPLRRLSCCGPRSASHARNR